MDCLILECVSNGLLPTSMSIVGGGCVAGVDGEELALNVWHKVIDPFDCFDLGWAVRRKRCLVNNPFVEGFDLDVEAGVGVLTWDNTVDGRVGKAGTLADGGETVFWSVFGVLDELREFIGSPNHVLTGNDSDWCRCSTGVDCFSNDWSNEFEDVGADSAGDLEAASVAAACRLTTCVGVYQVCTGDFLHGIFLVGLGVDSTVIADGVDFLAFPSNLGDSVTLGLLELLNELVHDIDENNLQGERLANTLCQHLGEGSSYLKARLEQLLGNEATANVSTSEVDSFESHLEGHGDFFVIGERLICERRKCSVFATRGETCRLGTGGNRAGEMVLKLGI